MQRSDKPSRETTLARYLPDGSVPYVVHLLKTYPVRFRIVRPRKSKLGDFRVREGEDLPEITVNGDLNPYSFLITTVHEFAHLKTWMEYRFSAAPHGKEWKRRAVVGDGASEPRHARRSLRCAARLQQHAPQPRLQTRSACPADIPTQGWA